MSTLYPRLPRPIAERLFDQADTLTPATEHPGQIFAPVGGRRARPEDLARLGTQLRDLAGEFGFPVPPLRGSRIEFDRRSAQLMVEAMDLSWSEAAAHDVWSFVALVVAPDVTRWRFRPDNRERWVATDLTRHTWARAWWRGTVFGARPDLLAALSESDLNQILERRIIGGDPRLAVALADALIAATEGIEAQRRPLIRDAAARLRRRLAFIDPRALDDAAVVDLCATQISESLELLPREPDSRDIHEE
ncbi:hypothetical protein J2Y46_003871 [Microbacterium sp. BE35]|uniref:hypothetical protein n=1 Tax=Microbacterium sp. BE35 TaxID=2817773 RepID=UPI0028566672|nr:hypothetical protein [Microbacterium sp. BE35]MDR7191013.1 hypothetical protein [Microbacterium sp. BE35]